MAKKAKQRQRRERGRLHVTWRNGIAYITGTVHGIEVHESTGTRDAVQAEALRVKKEAELLDRKVHGDEVVVTFAECAKKYLDEKDGGSMRRHFGKLIEKFGDVRVRQITNDMIRQYALQRFPDAKNSTRNACVIEPMRAILNHAAKLNIITKPLIPAFDDDSSRVVGASPEWVDRFLAETQDVELKAYVALTTTTGARCIDARKLLASDVDYEKGTATLRYTKNGKDRVIQIGPIAPLLRALPVAPDGRLFPWPTTTYVNARLIREAQRLGLEPYTSHQVGRHAFAERMLNAGYTLLEVAEMGGWDDLQVLKKNYGHLEKKRTDEIAREHAAKLMRGTMRVVK